MKPFSILIFLLLWISNESLGQNLNVVRNLGKVNFADSGDLVLSAKVESGKYTYELTDTKDPETPVFSFTLVSNSLDVFKASIKAKIAESGKNITVTDPTLEKYFFYFENQNPFLIEDIPGGMAMEMVFSDSYTIYNFKHNDLTQIKRNDVLELLNSFTETVILEEEFDAAEFNFGTYKSLKIKIKNVTMDLFDSIFQVRLEEIKNGSPKNLRWEELYKEIQYQYYKRLSSYIISKVNEIDDNGIQTIDQIQGKIDLLNSLQNRLSSENEKLKLENQEKLVKIENSKSKVILLKEGVRSKMDLLDYTENTFSDEETFYNYFDSKFNSNFTLLRSLNYDIPVDSIPIVNIVGLDSLKLEGLYKSDLAKIQIKASDIREIDLENIRQTEYQGTISQNIERIKKNDDSLSMVKFELSARDLEVNSLKEKINTKVKDELNYLKNSNKFNFKARNVQMEFNRGYLENIVVVGEASIFIEQELNKYKLDIPKEELTLKFVNDYPIGISAKRDLELLGDIKLYARFQDDVHYEMRIGGLITNIKEILALDRTDYSPEDGIVTVNLLTEKKKELKKSSTKEILQLKVFSDFVGLQEENPNGLIQFEVDKEIPLITKRSTKPYFGPIRFLVNKGGNIGYLNFIKPRFIYSKIEENNSSLEPESISVATENDTVQMFGTSALEIKQFERFSIGADLNLLLYNIPYGKSTFLVNAGMHFGRTDFTAFDTIPELTNYPRAFTNTYQPSFELLWRITGDERYGLEFSYGINWIISDRQNFEQISNTIDTSDSQIYNVGDTQYGIQRFMILAYLNIDPKTSGRMFFRYRSNSELWNFENNYSQLQIGYTTYLTKKSQ